MNFLIIILLVVRTKMGFFFIFILQLRFQKCIDAHPEIVQKVTATEQEKTKGKIDKEKEKVS